MHNETQGVSVSPGERLARDLFTTGRISATEFGVLRAGHVRELHTSILLGRVILQPSDTAPGLEAASRVLNTAELLEHVLSFLPPVSQLRARRVCKEFSHAITTSPTLQRVAFSRPQPQLEPGSVPPFGIRGVHVSPTQTRGAPGVLLVIDLNGISRRRFKDLRRSPTLRRVLIAQPPPVSATVSADCNCRPGKRRAASRPGGIRFGDVWDTLRDLLGGRRRCARCGVYYYVRVNGTCPGANT